MRNDVRPDCFKSLMFAKSNVVPDVSHRCGTFDFRPVFQEEIHLNLQAVEKQHFRCKVMQESARCYIPGEHLHMLH